jgi:uroporphyrinogen-III synthase
MNNFKELGIEAPVAAFTGDKIKLNKILNESIIVHRYKIEPSKFEKGDGKRLVLQIEKNGTNYILFTSSVTLKEMIQQVPTSKFPFETIIKMIDERPQFT